MSIQFGTDGWRAKVGEDFTVENVKLCTQAVCNYLKSREIADNGLMVGYDTRVGSADFAVAVTEVAAGNSIPVTLCDRPAPTPVVSYNLVRRDCAAGVIITASHNPSDWNGFKFKPGYGGSASQEIITELETCLDSVLEDQQYLSLPITDAEKVGLVERVNPELLYLNHVAGLVDLGSIRNAGLNVIVDSMHGAGSGYIRQLLEGGTTHVTEIRNEMDPTFPDMKQPEPIDRNLEPLKEIIWNSNGDVGLATDGDADRLGLVDEYGNYISTLHTFALICQHLLENLGMTGTLVRSITMTCMIDKLGDLHKVPVIDTPVGFKHLGPVMMEEDAIVAGEESGGYGFKGHIPERDGILSALMILDMMVKTNKNPADLISDLIDRVGPHHYNRIDLTFQPEERGQIEERLAKAQPREIGNLTVAEIDTRDGYRYVLKDGYWGLIRFSGTEPLIRIYAESESPNSVNSIIEECRNIAGI